MLCRELHRLLFHQKGVSWMGLEKVVLVCISSYMLQRAYPSESEETRLVEISFSIIDSRRNGWWRPSWNPRRCNTQTQCGSSVLDWYNLVVYSLIRVFVFCWQDGWCGLAVTSWEKKPPLKTVTAVKHTVSDCWVIKNMNDVITGATSSFLIPSPRSFMETFYMSDIDVSECQRDYVA